MCKFFSRSRSRLCCNKMNKFKVILALRPYGATPAATCVIVSRVVQGDRMSATHTWLCLLRVFNHAFLKTNQHMRCPGWGEPNFYFDFGATTDKCAKVDADRIPRFVVLGFVVSRRIWAQRGVSALFMCCALSMCCGWFILCGWDQVGKCVSSSTRKFTKELLGEEREREKYRPCLVSNGRRSLPPTH